MISNNAKTFALVSLCLAIIYIFCPFRILIKKYVAEDDYAVEKPNKYKDHALKFSTYYDKENPITA